MKLFLGFGGTCATTALLTAVTMTFGVPFTGYSGAYRERLSEARRTLNLTADLKAERLSLWLQERKGDAVLLGREPHVSAMFRVLETQVETGRKLWETPEQTRSDLLGNESVRMLTRHFHLVSDTYRGYSKIRAVEASGAVIVASTVESDVGSRLSDTSCFKHALKHPGGVLVDFEESSTNGAPHLLLCKSISPQAAGLSHGGAPPGVVIMYIDAGQFIRPLLYMGKGLGETGEIVLVDGDRRVIISSRSPLPDAGKPLPSARRMDTEAARLAAAGKQGLAESMDYRNVPVMAAYRPIEISPDQRWGLVVKRDKEEVFAAQKESLVNLLLIGMVGTLGAGIPALVLAGGIARPIETLSRIAARVETGDFEVRAPVEGTDEVGILAGSFNSMIERVGNRQRDLEVQLKLKTDGLRQLTEELAQEIEVRKETEESLRMSEQRYRTLVENMSTCVAIYESVDDGEDFVFVDFNHAAELTEGIGRDRLLSKSVRQVFPGVRESGLFEVFQRVWKTGKSERHAVSLYKDDRSEGWRENFIYKLPSGEIVALYTDETARKSAEEALRRSEALLTNIIEQSPFSMWISDAEGTLQRINPACKKWTRLTDREVVGKYNVLRDEAVEAQGLMPLVRSVFEEGRTVNFELTWDSTLLKHIQHTEATTLILDVTIFPVKDEQGIITNAVCLHIDITDRKKAEEEVRKLNEELEKRVRQRTAELEIANNDLEAFAYTVSHDLRAPLRAISGFSQIVAQRHRESLDGEGQRYVDNIVGASEQMDRLINDLLAYSRLGRKAVNWELVSLKDVVSQVIDNLSDRVQRSGADLILPDEMPVIDGVRTLLSRILSNLLDNALAYHRDDVPPKIVIDVHTDEDFVVLSVRDNGLGIAPESRDKIFNVFQRLHRDESYPGTGIGLAVVRKSAEMLGGNVWVESTVGEGSEFFVRLPLKKGRVTGQPTRKGDVYE
ncbi:MAG: ATP-binding protein [Pseudomonadota bacterium]